MYDLLLQEIVITTIYCQFYWHSYESVVFLCIFLLIIILLNLPLGMNFALQYNFFLIIL